MGERAKEVVSPTITFAISADSSTFPTLVTILPDRSVEVVDCHECSTNAYLNLRLVYHQPARPDQRVPQSTRSFAKTVDCGANRDVCTTLRDVHRCVVREADGRYRPPRGERRTSVTTGSTSGLRGSVFFYNQRTVASRSRKELERKDLGVSASLIHCGTKIGERFGVCW